MNRPRPVSAQSLPTPPLALARVIRIAGDPEGALADLARTCAQDPGLTMELLRVANAARYAAAQPIRSVPQAVVKLGARAVRNHALTHALRTSTARQQTGGFHTRRFWEDSLRRACAARIIAEALRDPDPQEAFAVGICQDLGSLLLAIQRPDLGEALEELRGRPGDSRRQAERVLCGRDHTQALAASAFMDMLPEDMRTAIALHHCPPSGPGRAARLARIAWAADHLADVAQAMPKALVLQRAEGALAAVGLPDRLPELYRALRQTMADDASDLAIPVAEQPTLHQVRAQAERAMRALADEQAGWCAAPSPPVRRPPSRRPAGVFATKDTLTALDNRKTFEHRAEAAVSAALAEGRSVTLAIVDVDHLRRINDEHGTAAGDAVLQSVARRLSGVVRDQDVIGRVGGEEFGVLLVDAGPTTARVMVERMRAAVRQLPVDTPAGRLGVRVSLGVAVLDPRTPARSPLELLDLADRALYRAKRAGRDQACYAPRPEARRAAG